MAKQDSNYIKIALLVIAALVVAVFGITYLKGASIFQKDKNYYSIFNSAKGLEKANRLVLLGVDVGQVEDIEFINNYEQIKVTFKISKEIKLPKDSKVLIDPGIPGFGSPSLKLQLGEDTEHLKAGSQVESVSPVSISDKAQEIVKNIEPTVNNLNSVLLSLDTAVNNINVLVTGNNGRNLEHSIASLNATMRNLNVTSRKVSSLVDGQSIRIEQILTNLESISGNLASNKDNIDRIMTNFSTTSDELASLKFRRTLDEINSTMENLNAVVTKISEGDGTLSLLVNDATLYNNLNDAARDLDRLILNLKENPANYVPPISIFGKNKKNKN